MALLPFGVLGAEDWPTDPAQRLSPPELQSDQVPGIRALFEKLGAADFEKRDEALRALVQRGSPVLKLAEEYAKHPTAEIASQARGLRARVLLAYDGYLPVAPKLEEALARPYVQNIEEGAAVAESGAAGGVFDSLVATAGLQGIELLVDPEATAREGWVPGAFVIRQGQRSPTLGDWFGNVGLALGLEVVPRGDVLVLTHATRAQMLKRQRHTFDWSHWKLDKEEAQRVSDTLRAFFPPVSTEVQPGSAALSIRGASGTIARAARLLALLEPEGRDAQWPERTDGFSTQAALDRLARPVSLFMNHTDLVQALSELKRQNAPVALWVEGKRYEHEPYPPEIEGLAPIRLQLKDHPLGLTLRWLAHRSVWVGAEREIFRLVAEVDASGQPGLRLARAANGILEWAVGGMDVRFLTPSNLADGPKADEVLQALLLKELGPYLELFPSFEPTLSLRVVRGKALVQASPAAVAAFRDLVREWKANGKPPAAPSGERMDAILERKVEWNGTGLTAGTLLKQLRKLSGCAIFLEDGPRGEPAYFKLTREQAQLLPPGTQTLKALFDDLARQSGAQWAVRWGVITLTPGPAAPQPEGVQP
ncbi:MAG: hypothetical protein HS116_21830 [Planctomycetes bacterium]|nr:hypothetical protein [Planctomycetota bacterium]